MKLFFAFIRFFFVSLEAVIFIISLVLLYYYGSTSIPVFEKVLEDNDFLKYVAMLPSGIFIWMLVYCRKSLIPEKDIRGIMPSWPCYGIFRVGIFAAILWGLLFAMMAIGGWIASINEHYEIAAILLVFSIIGSLIDAFSVYMAELSINENFCKGQDTADLISSSRDLS